MKTEGERIAVLEAQGRWTASMLEKMDKKMDRLLEAHWKLYAKVTGISVVTTAVTILFIRIASAAIFKGFGQ